MGGAVESDQQERGRDRGRAGGANGGGGVEGEGLHSGMGFIGGAGPPRSGVLLDTVTGIQYWRA